jgi:hypothetical protein
MKRKYAYTQHNRVIIKDRYESRCLGEYVVDVDGFYYFWPDPSRGGCYPSWLLISIGKRLEKLNRKWNQKIDDYFNRQP